jgi:hypothetical protein
VTWPRRRQPELSAAGRRFFRAVDILGGAAVGATWAAGHNPVLAVPVVLVVAGIVAWVWRRRWLYGGGWPQGRK